MSEIERVTLVGNLTADPELRFTPSGLQVANLRLAVTPRTRQEDGSWTQGRPASTPSPSGATKPATRPRPSARARG
jgi:single-stranded DNA-binding protein